VPWRSPSLQASVVAGVARKGHTGYDRPRWWLVLVLSRNKARGWGGAPALRRLVVLESPAHWSGPSAAAWMIEVRGVAAWEARAESTTSSRVRV